MSAVREIADIDQLVAMAPSGDAAAALSSMREVRSGRLSFEEEVRIVDALYDARHQYQSRRFHFALALLCARTASHARARALLLDLVAADYPPAMHFLGADLVENGRTSAGLHLLDLARASGYRLGDVSYWRYQTRVARGPKRHWLMFKVVGARLVARWRKSTGDELDLAYWLPEATQSPRSDV